MALSEADTHAKLVNPAIYRRGWTEEHVKREETTGTVDIIAGKARRRSRGRTDLTLRVVVTAGMQPVAVAVIEVKKDTLPPDHFSHVVIDECHRSAWGKWSKVLTMNPTAVQIGLTATPRELTTTEDTDEARADAEITADNLRYFGEPVYEYGIAQAMEDGYLAACDVKLARVDLDARGLTAPEVIRRDPTDADTGRPLTPREIADRYDANTFERDLILPDRVRAMCRDLFDQMLANVIHRGPDGRPLGPRQKTIIFCATDRHADLVAAEMNNLFAAWCQATGAERFDPYAFKCTASVGGNDFIPDFRGAARTHFVATTVELLTTGVDVKPVRNVAIFKYVASPIAFYQMIGRGTRIDEPTGKLVFTIYDYTGATRLFGEAFVSRPTGGGGGDGGGEEPPPPPPDPTVWVEGFAPVVNDLGRFVGTTVDGRMGMVPLEDYQRGLAAALVKDCPTLTAFRGRWIDPPSRRELLDALVSAGYSPQVVRLLEDRTDYDLYDVLGELGYGLSPRTRIDRAVAFRYKHDDWLRKLPDRTRAAVIAVADQFAKGATEILFLQSIIRTLAPGGRCGVVLPEGVLFRTTEEAFTKTKKKLLEECDLWCVVSLPGGVFTAAGAGVKTNLLFFTRGQPTERIWYYDLSGRKVGKKTPLTLDDFQDFFEKLPTRADSDRSWTVDFTARRRKAADDARPFRQTEGEKKTEAEVLKDALGVLKKARPRDDAKIAAAEAALDAVNRARREAAAKAQAIEDAVYDLKAVNPNRRAVVDKRTPAELLDLIEAKGREVASILTALRAMHAR